MASTLTDEQRKTIAENKKRALEIRAAKFASNSTNNNNAFLATSSNITSNNGLNHNIVPNIIKDYSNNNNFKNAMPSVGCSSKTKPSDSLKTTVASNFYNKQNDIIDINCCLTSRNRFSVTNKYSKELIEVFKTIPGKLYDAKTLKWSFPLSEYQNFISAVKKLKNMNCKFSYIPNYVLKTFSNSLPVNYKSIDVSQIDEVLLHSLYPFQLEGVQFGISKNGRCIIADDMGLGKTIQALGIAHYYVTDWPLLIVSPSSMRFQWELEITTCLPSVPLINMCVMSTSKNNIKGAKIVITSYDLMSRCEKVLKEHKFGVIIMDESHSIKGWKTHRTQSALRLIQSAKRCILLSGTPALSRPVELYPQIYAVDSTAFSYQFGVRYCEAKQSKFGWDYSGSSNMEELQLLLEERFMIRRLKSNVLNQLPSKIREIVILDSEKIKMEEKVLSAFTEKLNSVDAKAMEKRGTLLSYFAETSKTKTKAVQEYITRLLEDKQKFLVYAHHRQMLDAICDLLESNSTYYIRIDGSTSSEERKSVCDQFQFDDKFRVAVLSVTAASTGITLTAAHLVVFAELFWNPGVLTQAEDRVHRIGQQNGVLIQYLIAKGTADDHLWPLIQSKLNILNKAGLSKDNFLCDNTSMKKEKKKQPTILDYFQEFNSMDDAELSNVIDEIEETECKRTKLEQ